MNPYTKRIGDRAVHPIGPIRQYCLAFVGAVQREVALRGVHRVAAGAEWRACRAAPLGVRGSAATSPAAGAGAPETCGSTAGPS